VTLSPIKLFRGDAIDRLVEVFSGFTDFVGGGSEPYAVVQGAPNGVANGAPIPFGAVLVDADSLWDAGNHQFVIPAGAGGTWRVSAYLNPVGSDGDLGPVVLAYAATSGAFQNIYVPLGSDGGVNSYTGTLDGLMILADGDTLTAAVLYTGPASDLNLNIGTFSLQRIGDS
jgi:hypothetical protein